METLSLYILTLFTISITSCSVEPQPINWGKDACNFCKMNIVDKMHAAEYVTPKGKVFKYDAIECLVNELIDDGFPKRKFTLVSNYGGKGEFIDAANAYFLISESIPSPMGGFLSAFSENTKAIKIQKESKGEILSWDELILKYKTKK